MTETEERRLGFRAWLEQRPALLHTYRIGVALLGAAILTLGIIAIPYPGPGWLIVFAGLAILASEFAWAKRVLAYVRGRYDAWTAWLGRQNPLVRLLVLAGTAVVVLATLWLFGVLSLVAGWVGLSGWTWLQSPLFG